jgi:hypothetical protein
VCVCVYFDIFFLLNIIHSCLCCDEKIHEERNKFACDILELFLIVTDRGCM